MAGQQTTPEVRTPDTTGTGPKLARLSDRARTTSRVNRFSPYSALYRLPPADVHKMVVRGVPVRDLDALARRMGVPAARLADILGIAQLPATRQPQAKKLLGQADGERFIGLMRLLGQVKEMLAEAGGEEATDFDAPRWLAWWLDAPLPALGGDSPSAYMKTDAGQQVVSSLLGRMLSGVYA